MMCRMMEKVIQDVKNMESLSCKAGSDCFAGVCGHVSGERGQVFPKRGRP